MTTGIQRMLEVFDVAPDASSPGRYEGSSDAGDRDLIDASQILSQSIVAAGKSVPGKVVRRANGIFFRPVVAAAPIDFDVAVLQDGRSVAASIVSVAQESRPRATIQVMLDVPQEDVIRLPDEPPASGPDPAIPISMPLSGREVRLVGLADPNDPDEVGPPRIDAWVHYEPIPERTDLARALVAHFTGHLSISTAMRAHAGIGTDMAHKTVSTGVLAISVTFHEPFEWTGWLLYSHESTFAGAGVAYTHGQVRTEEGRLIASFTQDALLRRLDPSATALTERARL